MNIKGHELCVINTKWTFDLTDFVGYKTTIDKKTGKTLYTKAFRIRDNNRQCRFKYTRYINEIPIGILNKSEQFITNRYKEALLIEPNRNNF